MSDLLEFAAEHVRDGVDFVFASLALCLGVILLVLAHETCCDWKQP